MEIIPYDFLHLLLPACVHLFLSERKLRIQFCLTSQGSKPNLTVRSSFLKRVDILLGSSVLFKKIRNLRCYRVMTHWIDLV